MKIPFFSLMILHSKSALSRRILLSKNKHGCSRLLTLRNPFLELPNCLPKCSYQTSPSTYSSSVPKGVEFSQRRRHGAGSRRRHHVGNRLPTEQEFLWKTASSFTNTSVRTTTSSSLMDLSETNNTVHTAVVSLMSCSIKCPTHPRSPLQLYQNNTTKLCISAWDATTPSPSPLAG